MDVKIISAKENPLLKRTEVYFQVEYDKKASTPPRLEVKKAIASALKRDADLVFVKKLETKTGTHSGVGQANVYESLELAKSIEPSYIINRNTPPQEKPKEEEKKE